MILSYKIHVHLSVDDPHAQVFSIARRCLQLKDLTILKAEYNTNGTEKLIITIISEILTTNLVRKVITT